MKQSKGLLICTQVVDDRDDNLGFFVSWMRAFAQSGRTIYVLAWRVNLMTVLPANVHVMEMPKGKLRRTLTLWRFSFKYRNDIGAIFVHMMAPVVVASGWLWRLLGWRVALWYTHGDVPWTLQVANHFVHHIFTATEESCRLNTDKKIVTGHGIDLTIYKPQPITRRPLIITVGRIAPRKNQLEFVKLCARLREGGFDFEALIIGVPRLMSDTAYAEDVKASIVKNGLGDIIKLVGAKTGQELIALYSEAALLVNASTTGSLDKAVLEALACETPAIALGGAFRNLPGVTIVPSIAGDEALAIVRDSLEHPSSHPEARKGVDERANLQMLIKKIETILYVA